MFLRVPAGPQTLLFAAIHSFLTKQRAGISQCGGKRKAWLRVAGMALLCVGAVGASATTFTVTDNSDNPTDTGSLRYAVNNATAGSTINFASPLTGGNTITLIPGNGALQIYGNLTITGPGANQLTISGGGNIQVFFIGSAATVDISGLTIAGGFAGSGAIGGSVLNQGTLTVSACTFSGNSNTNSTFNLPLGGAIYTTGTLTVTQSTFINNTVGGAGEGGSIFVNSGAATVSNSTFVQNYAGSGGGSIGIETGSLKVINSTFANNSGGGGTGIISFNATVTANNNIFYSNGNSAIYSYGTTNADHNLYYNNNNGGCLGCTSDSNPISADPLLLPLGYYGGATETLLPRPGGAAICAGSSSDASSASLTADQRGWILNSANCSNNGVDAGSVQTNYLTVRTGGDSAAFLCPDAAGTLCSLRGAITQANTDTKEDINFLSSLDGQTITLSGTNGSLPTITGTVNMIGPGANLLTVSGGGSTSVGSVLTVNSGATVTLYGLTIRDGNNNNSATGGGGIQNYGTLTVLDSAISGNTAADEGGGIYNQGTLTVLDSSVSGNTAATGGGISSLASGTLTVTDSTVSGNSAVGDGLDASGGGINSYGSFTLTGSTVSGNSATCSRCINPVVGGGIQDDTGSVFAANSIVAGNTVVGGGLGGFAANADISGGLTDNGGNVADNRSNATSPYQNIILLSPLQYNGIGATVQTMIPLPGSVAICAGLASNIPSGTTTDERGYPLQPTSGYCTSSQVDAGAVQTNYLPLTTWVQQPTNVAVATSMSPAPALQILEKDTLLGSNNTDGVNGIPLTLRLTNGNSYLTGNTATTSGTGATAGTATFSSLKVSQPELNDQLNLAAMTLGTTSLGPLASDNFDVYGPVSATQSIASEALTQNYAASPFTPVTGSGGLAPLSYGISPSLPAGLSISSSSGTISGTPTVTSSATTYTVTVTDANSNKATNTFSLTLNSAVTATTVIASKGITVNNPPSPFTPVTGSGGTGSLDYTESPTLPPGIAMDPSTGSISGLPTIPTSASTYTVTVTDSLGATATSTFVLSVNTGVSAQTVVSNVSLYQNLAATPVTPVTGSGGTTPLSYGISPTLPSGLSINSLTGAITGTSTTPLATTSFSVTVTDQNGATASKSFNLTVNASQPPAITSAAYRAFPVGVSSSFPVTTTAIPIAAISESGALPAGVSFTDNGDGTATISGTPTGSAGSYPINITASNGISPNATQNFTLTVGTPSYVVTTLADEADSSANCNATGTGGNCSLRDAITAANAAGAGNIPFASGLTSTISPGTITLGTGTAGDIALPGMSGYVNITGPGANQLTVSGNNDRNVGSVFTVNSGAHVTLSGLTISHGNSGSWAGGIYNNGMLTVTGSVVSSNSSVSGAGIYNPTNAVLSILGSTLSANAATGGRGGGGIFNDGSLTIADSTIVGNTVDSVEPLGGGIYSSTTFTLSNSTVVGNSITCVPSGCYAGAGIYTGALGGGILLSRPSIAVIAANSIVAQNSASAVAPATANGADVDGTITDNGGNVIGTSTTGTSNLNPMLAPLGNYGGPTQTMIPLPGSAAICAGTSANAAAASITTDQRGGPFDAACASGSVDAGAVQSNYSIAFVQQPSTVVQGITMSPSPTVMLDESGTAFFDGADTFAIPLTLTTGSGTLSGGSVSTSATTGVATYSGLSISLPGTSDQLTATLSLNPGLSTPLSISKASNTFNVNSAVTQLAFGTSPSATITAGGNAGSSILVDEESVSSALVTTANDTITLTVTGPNSYSKTYTQAAVNGVATFNLSSSALTAAGGYSYAASIAGSASVTNASANETVNAAAAATVNEVTGSGQITTIGTVFAAPLKVLVEDQYSNPVPGATVSFTGPVSGAGATFTGSPATTATDGTASVTATANGTASITAYTAMASVSGATPASFTLTNTSQATTLTVTPSPASPVYGQTVTITAAISPASILASAPTGSMTFYDGTTALVPVSTVASAGASYTVSVPTVGSHTYAAQYGGDSNFKQSAMTTATAATVVAKASSTLSGPTSTVNLNYGAGGTITISLAGQYSGAGIATPSGSVSYTIGSGTAQTATIAAGAATLTIPATQAAGGYTVSVNYSGDGNYNAAAQITVNLSINPVVLTVTANNATKVYGTANPTFTGSVGGQQNGDTFTESFATSATISSPVNSYAIVPSVTGTNLADYTQSITDGSLSITQAASTTSVGLSSTSITPLQSVTITAAVASATTGTPTGSVAIYDNGTLLSTLTLSAGTASYVASALAPGLAHTITAQYLGDTNFTASSSTSTASVTVAPLDFTMTIAGPSTATVVPGSSIQYQVTVTPDYGSYGGTVNFTVAGLPPGATVTFSPASIAANGGSQTITVTIHAPPATAMEHAPSPPATGRRMEPFALAFLVLFGAGAMRRNRRALRRSLYVVVLLAVGAAAATLSGCGTSNGFFNQAAQNYSVTITATSGTLAHTAAVTLNVQ